MQNVQYQSTQTSQYHLKQLKEFLTKSNVHLYIKCIKASYPENHVDLHYDPRLFKLSNVQWSDRGQEFPEWRTSHCVSRRSAAEQGCGLVGWGICGICNRYMIKKWKYIFLYIERATFKLIYKNTYDLSQLQFTHSARDLTLIWLSE